MKTKKKSNPPPSDVRPKKLMTKIPIDEALDDEGKEQLAQFILRRSDPPDTDE